MNKPLYIPNFVPQVLEEADKDDVESKEDEKEENLDWSFYDNLGLPEPNPLPKRQRDTNEPLRIVYNYSYRKLGKFEGAEGTEKPSKFDKQITIKTNARIYRETMQESRFSQMIDQEQSEEEDNDDLIEPQTNKIYNLFSDPNMLVYKIRNSDPATFNIHKTVKGEGKGRICSFIEDNGLDYAECYYQPKGVEDTTLVFESRFESGNLAMAAKVNENEYNLLLQNDVNTAGYGQWFYFQVRNTRKDQKMKFNIINYRKNDSLHNYGLKVLTFSTKESQKSNSGWVRDGTNITYGSNGIVREHIPTKFYRTLTWEYQFKNNDDTVYFAYGHPYTYTDLVEYLDRIEADEAKARYFRRSTLCHTQAGNKCETITITYNRRPEDCERKQCIVLTARVHPGETCSSFVIQGVIDFLLSETKEAQALRENFIFKIIPMLNPDGVIHGNSRCSFAGDLNRKWKTPSQTLHPTIYYAKKLIQKLHRKYNVAFFCDFHGHSKKKDIFIYGCQNVGYSAEARMFPWILSQTSPMFNYRRCTFHIHHSKFTTARAAVFQELKIMNSCTVETSFFGSEETNCHYTANDLIKFGSEFSRALLVYFSGSLPCKVLGVLEDQEDIEKNIFLRKEEMVKKFFEAKENLEVGDNASDSGSDSAASDDDILSTDTKKVKKVNSPRKNENAKKNNKPKEPKVLKALVEQKVSAELKKAEEEQKVEKPKSETKPNKRLLKGISFGTSALEKQSPNLVASMNPNKLSQLNIVAIGHETMGTKQVLAKNFLSKKKTFADEYGLKEREIVPVKVHKMDHNINRGAKAKECLKGMDFVIAPNTEQSPDRKHKRAISLESRGDSNTQASTPRMPQQAFLPKMAVIENNFDQSMAHRPPLKSRKNIHHMGFNKIRNSTQQEDFNRFLYNNRSMKRSPRHRLAEINLSKERYEASLPNKSAASNNTALFDIERRGKLSSIVFEKVAEENLNISQISGEYIDEEDFSNTGSVQLYVQKRNKTKSSVSPDPVRKSEQQTYTATSLPVLQSLLGKIGQEDPAKLMNKEANSTLDSNLGVSREDSRYRGSPLDPRITYSTRQRFKILPKLLQYNFKETK